MEIATESVKRSVIFSFIVCVISSTRNNAFIFLVIALPLATWVLYGIYVAFRYPKRRIARMKRILAWVISGVIVLAANHYYEAKTNQNARIVTDAIESYYSLHGKYPNSIEDVGISENELRSLLGTSNYHLAKEKPRLLYTPNDNPYGKYVYQFEERKWLYVPGG